MKAEVLQRVLTFCRYIENTYMEMENLPDVEFEEKAKVFEWPQALYRMREGKNMQDVLNGVTPAELLLALRKYEDNKKEQDNDN